MPLTKIITKTFSILAIMIIGSFVLISPIQSHAASDTVPTTLTPGNDVICKEGACGAINSDASDGSDIKGATGVAKIIISIARLITYIAGGLAVLILVYGGVRYLTASDEKAVGTARQIIQNAIIGLVIAILAFAIISIVTNLFSGQFIANT